MTVRYQPFAYWPDNPYWSYQLLRVLATIPAGGADLGECHMAAAAMRPGEMWDWINGWHEIAKATERLGDAEASAGHALSGRDCHLRATTYYRAAEFFLQTLSAGSELALKEAIYAGARRSFQRALALLPVGAEEVQIPFDESFLAGYVFAKRNPGTDKRVLLVFGGSDSIAEELYFLVGRAAAERGYTCVIVDGPGQGASLRLKGLPARPDFEVAVAAAIDYLRAREDTRDAPIGLMALSLGGYYAPRAAAFESRVAACVAWGALYDVPALLETYPVPGLLERHFAQLLRTDSEEETVARLAAFTLKGVLSRIKCPVLVLHGEDDTLVPVSQAERLTSEVRGDVTLRVFRRGEPGCLHCQVDGIEAAQREMLDWLDDRLPIRSRAGIPST